MEEKTFLNEAGITVTNARFIVSSQTYAMSGITSVKNSHEPPSRTGSTICGAIGLVLLILSAWLYGAVFVAVAVAFWFSEKSRYHIVLATSGGELKALTREDAALVARVVQALNDAIVFRG